MEEYLNPVELKLARVVKQVNELNDSIDNWTSSNPIKFEAKIAEDRLGFQLFVDDIKESSILEQWGILVGEIIHNLRSSLDNLAYALARLKNDPPNNPEKIQFPIFQEEAKFLNKKQELLSYLQKDIVDLIEQFQPFQRLNPSIEGQPNTDPLVLLQSLNNFDKHRIPVVGLLSPSNFTPSLKIFFYDNLQGEKSPPKLEIFGYPLKIGSIVINCTTERRIKNINIEGNFSADIVIQGVNGFEQITEILQKLHWYISQILDHFRKYFIK